MTHIGEKPDNVHTYLALQQVIYPTEWQETKRNGGKGLKIITMYLLPSTQWSDKEMANAGEDLIKMYLLQQVILPIGPQETKWNDPYYIQVKDLAMHLWNKSSTQYSDTKRTEMTNAGERSHKL